MDLKKIIANNIFILRNQHDLTQEEFAEKINITRSHLSHIENADNMPSAEFIKDVCQSFGVSADWILNTYPQDPKDVLSFNDIDLIAVSKFHNLSYKMQQAVLNLISELEEIELKK